MPGIGIIANPHSKLNKRNPKRQELLSYIVGQQGQVQVTQDLEALAQVAKDFRKKDIEILAINGGDGSINCALQAFIAEYHDQPLPKIALLRGGTMNVLANNLGVKGSPEGILYQIVERHSTEKPFKIQSVRMINVDGHLGFLFGCGLAARFLERFYQNKSGVLGILSLISRIVGSFFIGGRLYKSLVRDDPMVIESSGTPQMQYQTVACFASTIDRMPMGCRLFPGAMSRPEQFEFVSFPLRSRDVVWQLPLLMLKNWKESPRSLLKVSTNEVVMTCDTIESYTVDGELFRVNDQRVSIKLGPEIEFVTL